MEAHPTSPPLVVVVGVDGSVNSAHAIEHAVQEARWRGATLRAITTWEYPIAYGYEGAGLLLDSQPLEDGARHRLDESLAVAIPEPSVRAAVERVVVMGAASRTLIEESKREGVDLIVVGARGHGGFVGLLLGSVSTAVVKHAECPVLVVPCDRPEIVETGDNEE